MSKRKRIYQILPHRADLKLKIFGKNKKELFLNATKALFEISKAEGEGEIKKRKIEVSSPSLEQLFVDYLSEVLYLGEVNHEVYFDVVFEKFQDTQIRAYLFGKKIKSQKLGIKGVTYHNLKITQRKDKSFEATVLFDI